VLTELLSRIMRDESRHFFFYFSQARRRLQRPGAARVARVLVDRFWAPVGSRVQPPEETRFLAAYLFSGTEGRAAVSKVDETIQRLPGFEDARLLQTWLDREGVFEPTRRGGRLSAQTPRRNRTRTRASFLPLADAAQVE
jgi:hypothetical protein